MIHSVRPIRTEEDYEAALTEIERLWGAPAGTVAGDRLDVLATLIDAYETTRDPFDLPDPIAAIRFRMEQLGLTPRDLVPLIGPEARVAAVLDGRRALSLPMIRRLHRQLGISGDVLIQPTRRDSVA